MNNVFIAIGASVLATFIWEFVFIDTDTIWRPSVLLTFIADVLTTTFSRIGQFWAWISSFLTFIKWEKLCKTLNVLLTPICDIALSWMYLWKGYYNYISRLSLNRSVVRFGSFTLLGLVATGLWYFGYVPALLDIMHQFKENLIAYTPSFVKEILVAIIKPVLFVSFFVLLGAFLFIVLNQ